MSMMKSQANCYMNIYLLKENIDSKEKLLTTREC
jgi:hypothetical protein